MNETTDLLVSFYSIIPVIIYITGLFASDYVLLATMVWFPPCSFRGIPFHFSPFSPLLSISVPLLTSDAASLVVVGRRYTVTDAVQAGCVWHSRAKQVVAAVAAELLEDLKDKSVKCASRCSESLIKLREWILV